MDIVVEEDITVGFPTERENIYQPKRKKNTRYNTEKCVHFKRMFVYNDEGFENNVERSVARIGGMVGTNYAATAIADSQCQAQIEILTFDDSILSIGLNKTDDDIHLLAKLSYEIPVNHPNTVNILEEILWNGFPKLT